MSGQRLKPLVIDTDCGVDDSLAILLALSRHQKDWSVEAITCCRGVTNVDQVASNVLRILNYVGLREIPVYKGCSKPILDNAHFESDFHGVDGLGGASDSLPLGADQKVQQDYGPVGLIRHVSASPREVTVLALGPLTNLAIAHRLEPEFSANIKQLVLMGGNSEGIGNQTAMAEFNFFVDPEAAHTVLTEFQCPILIYPWEPCLAQPLPWEWFDKWLLKKSRVAALITKITEKSQEWDRNNQQKDGYVSPDGIAAACCLSPETVIAGSRLACGLAVELSGQHCRGLLVQDRRNQSCQGTDEAKSRVTLVTSVHVDKVQGMLELVTDDSWLKS